MAIGDSIRSALAANDKEEVRKFLRAYQKRMIIESFKKVLRKIGL